MVKRKILSSPLTFLSIVAAYPELKNIKPFEAFVRIASQGTAGCNCHKSERLKLFKTQFESAFGALSDADRAGVKKILNVEELCYYVSTSQGLLVMRCF